MFRWSIPLLTGDIAMFFVLVSENSFRKPSSTTLFRCAQMSNKWDYFCNMASKLFRPVRNTTSSQHLDGLLLHHLLIILDGFVLKPDRVS
jgi:hypothetical protein